MSAAVFYPDERGFIHACPACAQLNRLTYERLGHAFRCASCQTTLPVPADTVEVSEAASFQALIARSAWPVLVDFWAPWCGPCRMTAPELSKVAAAESGRWLVIKVNTDALPNVAAHHSIQSLPTMVVFAQGRELARQSGAMLARQILQFIQPYATLPTP